MILLLITTLLASSVCSLSSSVPRQFHVVMELKNWTEAQQYCREKFTDLATIDNMTEMEAVKSLIQEAGVENVWIGLKQGKWQWSLDGIQNKLDFWNLIESQPDGQGSEQKNEGAYCVVQKKGLRGVEWFDQSCSETWTFICFDGINPTHPYVLVNEEKTWADAQRYCREKHTDLASLRDGTEFIQIEKVRRDKDVWIGLYRAWEWSDGSSSSFRHLYRTRGPYNKDVACTEIKGGDHHWNGADCASPKNFICYEDELVLVRKNKTWNEALQYCQENHVDLVSVRSEPIQHWVQTLARNASTSHVWLGLRHACGVGWFWVWGETVCYDNWAPGQGQVQGCQGLGAVKAGENGGKWFSNLTETEELNFICTNVED